MIGPVEVPSRTPSGIVTYNISTRLTYHVLSTFGKFAGVLVCLPRTVPVFAGSLTLLDECFQARTNTATAREGIIRDQNGPSDGGDVFLLLCLPLVAQEED